MYKKIIIASLAVGLTIFIFPILVVYSDMGTAICVVLLVLAAMGLYVFRHNGNNTKGK